MRNSKNPADGESKGMIKELPGGGGSQAVIQGKIRQPHRLEMDVCELEREIV